MKRYLVPVLLAFLAAGGAGAQSQINDNDPPVIYSGQCCAGPVPWNYVGQDGDYQNDEHNSNRSHR